LSFLLLLNFLLTKMKALSRFFKNNFLSSFVVVPLQDLCQERFEGVIGNQVKE